MVKRLELKVRKFWGLIPTFVEVTGEKLVVGGGGLPPILNRVNCPQINYVCVLNEPVMTFALFSKKYKFVEHNGS